MEFSGLPLDGGDDGTWGPKLLTSLTELRDAVNTIGRLVVNVRDFGANGDGATDDTAAIQSALDAAYALPGATVRVPPGPMGVSNYKITDRLVVRANTTIDATGATISAYWPGTGGDHIMLVNGTPGDTATGYAGHGNITLIGGIWDARGQATAATFSSPFAFSHANRLRFLNVTMRNVYRGHAIDLCASRDVRFIGCSFEGYTDTGNPRTTEAIQVDLATATGFPTFGGYDNTPCDDVLVLGCRFTSSADAGLWPRAVGSHNARTDRPHTNIRVVGCHIEAKTEAVLAYNWRDFVVSGNTCVGAPIGVLAIDATTPGENTMNNAGTQTNASAELGPGTIVGNTVNGSAGHGIYLTGYPTSGLVRNVTVSGNTIRGQVGSTAYQGIRVDKASGCVISANIVRDSPSHSIEVIASANIDVAGNHTSRGAQLGIMLDSSTACIIANNHLTEPGQHGISLSGSGSDHAIRNNTVIGAGYTSNNTMVGIRLNSVSNCSVIGNTVRKGTGANQAQYGLQIASGASGTFYQMNDLRLSGVTASLNDVGTGSLTTAANQV